MDIEREECRVIFNFQMVVVVVVAWWC